jgi:hypothetical protein
MKRSIIPVVTLALVLVGCATVPRNQATKEAKGSDMTQFKPKQVTRHYTQRFLAGPEKVFPLLCPTREYEWIEPWECELLRSESGVAEANCVFRTRSPEDGSEEVWVISRHEPSRRIDFVRQDRRRVMSYSIILEANADGTTTARNTQVLTALTEEGSRLLEGQGDEAFAFELRMGEAMLNHYLTTGKRLPIAEAIEAAKKTAKP